MIQQSAEELKRAQQNGRETQRRARAGKIPMQDRILYRLKAGPASLAQLIELLKGSPDSVRQRIGMMRRLGQVRRCDTRVPVYALNCRFELGQEEVPTRTRYIKKTEPRPAKPSRSAGSGVIAGRIEIHGYRYGGGLGPNGRKLGAI